MNLQEQNVMFFTRATQHGGTENVVLQMCKILKEKVNSVIVCSANGFDVDKLHEMGIKHYQIPDIEVKSPQNIIKVIKKVSQIIKDEKISVVHTHHRMAAFYSYILSNRYNFTFINTSHNTFYDKKKLTRLAFKKAHLTTCGEMVKKNLIDYYELCDKNITVLHNAIEPFEEKIVPIDELSNLKSEGYTLVGNIGRLSEQKGMEYFISSYPLVKQKCEKVKYIVVGDGEDKSKLRELTKKLDIENDVIFLGYRTDVRNVMSQLDFIVLSSLWEGLPLTPIEAFSVGKTVIATAVDGTVEIVDDGKNGFLIEPKNVQQIAERIIHLISVPEQKKAMEIICKDTFEKKFSFQQYKNKLLKYYLNLN